MLTPRIELYNGAIAGGPTMVTIELASAAKVYPYQNSYYFGISSLKFTNCRCSCVTQPTCLGSCKYEKKFVNCYDFTVSTTENTCKKAEVDVCCNLEVKEPKAPVYRAISISEHFIRKRFVSHIYNIRSGAWLSTGEIIVMIGPDGTGAQDGGKNRFLHIQSEMLSTSRHHNIPKAWYYGAARSSEIKTKLPVNSDKSWGTEKLGWSKHSSQGILLDLDVIQKSVGATCRNGTADVRGKFGVWYNRIPYRGEHLSFSNQWSERVYRNDTSEEVN